jgi:glycosyltransferase involved in cell wall biosynthesis
MLATARVLADQGYRVTIVTTPGTRVRAAEQAGFRARFAELPADPWRQPFALMRTRKLLRRLKPDVLHATADSLVPLMSIVAPALGVPWIQELHAPVTGPLFRDPARLATAIVSSESLVEGAVNRGGLPRALVRFVRNAPPPNATLAAEPFRHEGPPRIGCSGLLDDHHATPWFLEAARLMVLSGTRAMFLVLGEGPTEGVLRRFVRDRGMNEHVTIAVPTTGDAAESLGALDVHVSCKLQSGPGWLASQALAQGVPSIFVAAGDAFELIEDKSNGILVEPGNPRRLADELTLLCSQPERARRMGARGRVRLQEYAPFRRFELEVAETHALALGRAFTGV